ncbi:hypothetical protein Q5M85_23245 [Paraclostridium bifermentans]|nr:hypothetical protein [Paraclostridium bifermentans]
MMTITLEQNIIEGLNYTNQVKQIESEKIRALYDNKIFSVSRLEKICSMSICLFYTIWVKSKRKKRI